MIEEHQHLVRYTITMIDRHWWGQRIKLDIIGTRSSQLNGELLIFLPGGGFHSINYLRVWMMTADPIEHTHER